MARTDAARCPLRVLLVRPERSPDEFADSLIRLGATVYRCPVMAIVPLNDGQPAEQIKSRVLDFDHYQIAIFISRNAARLGLEWLDSYWPMLPAGVRYYAVGKSTAEVLEAYGVSVEAPGGSSDSEALLALPSLQSVSGERALLFAGRGGRGLLAEELARRGARVERCELYERQKTLGHAEEINRLLSGGELQLLVAHSGELLTHLLDVVAEENRRKLLALPLLVPGQRVAGLASHLGWQEVIVANSALRNDMVSAILEWYSNNG